MALDGISSLGITFGFGTETTAGSKPSAFTKLNRINSIGGITIEPETIDASALEDFVTKTIAGRADTGGTWSVTVNATDDTIEEWNEVISEQAGLSGGKRMWFEVIIPGLSKAFFVVAEPPKELPLPELSQNELLTMEIQLTIQEYKGMDTKVSFT